jgi:hypothetical protein
MKANRHMRDPLIFVYGLWWGGAPQRFWPTATKSTYLWCRGHLKAVFRFHNDCRRFVADLWCTLAPHGCLAHGLSRYLGIRVSSHLSWTGITHGSFNHVHGARGVAASPVSPIYLTGIPSGGDREWT